jgi:hypothetical protein
MTFKRIAKPEEQHPGWLLTRRPRRNVPTTCNHVRPRRSCAACAAYYVKHYGEEKGMRRFKESVKTWNRRCVPAPDVHRRPYEDPMF